MFGARRAGGIARLLSAPTVARTFILALVGRFAYGLLPLCFLFTIRNASGSFTVAALASAVMGLATLAMPIQSRLADRHGQRRVLPVYAAGYCVLLLLTAGLSGRQLSPALWVGLALLAGLSAPALGPSMRAQWREIAAEGPQRRTAYSLDSVAEESLYLLGPIVAALILTTGHPQAGLVMAAAFIAVGTIALVRSPYQPAPAAHESLAAADDRQGHVLGAPGFARLLFVMLIFGITSAACFVGVAAAADRAGTPGAAGLVEAGMAAGAVIGGLAWARLGRTTSLMRTLGSLFLILACGQAAASWSAPHLLWIGAALSLAALATSPVFVVAFTTADDLVRDTQRTEASTWVSTGVNAGNALGTAAAGGLVGGSTHLPLLLAAVASTIAGALAFHAGRSTLSDGLVDRSSSDPLDARPRGAG